MQIARLFEMVYILLDKKSVTAKELADRFEVSARTVYRDMETLCAAGIPIYACRGRGGGIRLTDGFVLDKSLLSEGEQNEILTALQAMRAAQYPDGDRILDKLAVHFKKTATHWIEVDFSDWSHINRSLFDEIKSAILMQRMIRFDYYSSYGEKTLRTVEPAVLWFKHRGWYLRAFDCGKQDERVFKLSRMKRLSVLDEAFEARPEEAKRPTCPKTRAMHMLTLQLRVDASQLYRIYDEFGEDMVEQAEDGSFICTAEFPEDEWVYGFILSFGPFAQVLAPEHIREKTAEKLMEALRLYTLPPS